jgi:hypothetical protein
MHRQGIDERLPREIIPQTSRACGHGAGFSGAGTAEVTPLEIPRCSALLFSRKSKRRKQWPGRRPLWLKSASVSKSMAICQPMDMCRLSSSSLHYCLVDALTRRGLRFFVSGGDWDLSGSEGNTSSSLVMAILARAAANRCKSERLTAARKSRAIRFSLVGSAA